MYEHEKSILATLITHPKLISVFLDYGGNEDWFIGSESKATYKVLRDLEKNRRVTWDNIFAHCPVDIRAWFITELQRRTDVPPEGFSEKHLTMLIEEVEEFKAKAEIQGILNDSQDLNDTHIVLLKEALKKFDAPVKNKEEGSMQSAFREYSNWKNIEKTGVSTGFPTIDRYMGDLSWGEVFAIMGRTATGKTFVALNILQSLVLSKVKDLGFFSMEMSKSALTERMIQLWSGKHRNNIDEIDIRSTEDRFKKVKVYSKVYSVLELEGIIKKERLRVVFIDFLQLIKGSGISLYEKATNIIQDLKTMAKNLNIIVIILVQLSRKAGEGAEEVKLDMARDSGAIEENSDFIIGVWNPERQSKKEEGLMLMKDTRSLRLIKNKRGMTIGIHVHFNPDTGKMTEEER